MEGQEIALLNYIFYCFVLKFLILIYEIFICWLFDFHRVLENESAF